MRYANDMISSHHSDSASNKYLIHVDMF